MESLSERTRLIRGAGGNVLATRTSEGLVVVDGGLAEHRESVLAALDQAFGKAATELVLWTSRTIADQSQAAPASTKGPARGKTTRG